MEYLRRNTLPHFQERLDLAASDLNDMEEILCKAINELAGRLYIINNLVDESERTMYAEDTGSLLIATINTMKERLDAMQEQIDDIRDSYDDQLADMDARWLDLERRMNLLDAAAARKEDVNVILYRSGQ